MANQTGRPFAPARKLVAAVMGTIAVFVMALGLGMSSWGVVVFGVALLALSIALGMVNVVRRGARAWVSGTAEVRGITPPPASSAVYGRAEIHVVVVTPGLPTHEVTIREPRVPVVKWPVPGDTLPITVDVDDLRRVRIDWDATGPREVGEDPPGPPGMYGDTVVDEVDDDLLGDVEPPPWVNQDRQPPTDDDRPPGGSADEIVVRNTPNGPVVEGELVNPDAGSLPPPPTRPMSPPPAGATPPPPPTATTSAPPAESAAPPPPPAAAPPQPTPSQQAGSRPSPRPRPRPRPSDAGTATVTAEHATLIDVPLDDSPPDAAAGARGSSEAEPSSGTPHPRRPEPIATSTVVTPAPVASFPQAPAPTATSRKTSAPAARRPSGPRPYDDIDLPLDSHPGRPPEETTAAAGQTTPATTRPPAGDAGQPQFGPAPVGALNGIGLTVPVTDLSRSIAFYRDALGFHEIDGDSGSAVLASEDTRLVLQTIAGTPAGIARLTVNLGVSDVAAVYAELQASGVRFVHPPLPTSHGKRLESWSATFRDPDGHTIAITEWRHLG